MTRSRTEPATAGEPGAPPEAPQRDRTAAPWWRWAPLAAALLVVVAVLLLTGTPPLDLARFAAYAVLAVLLPGTLVFRALRRRPHTLVEDVALGAAVGLVLELAAWAGYSAAGAQRLLWTWPALVVAAFLAMPALRRHWRVRYPAAVPGGWAWAVAGVVAGFTWYLAESFLRRNPVLPTDEGQLQYLDLAFQLSIAGEAMHRVPPGLPQVAGEPLHYHWFGFAHMAAASLVSGADLTTVFFRLAVPALCALAIVLTAVVGWRVSGRPYVGAGAAVLLFAVGEFGFENGWRSLFGTQATFIVWGSPSMTYSWVLLLPLIAVLADRLARAGAPGGDPGGGGPGAVPELGRGAWVLAALLLAGSAGAKASSVPVVAGALGLTAVVLLVAHRRLPGAVIGAGLLAGAAQLFATAVLFGFESHGIEVRPGSGLRPFAGPDASALVWVGVVVAYLLNMQLRLAGMPALLWLRGPRPVPVFLAAGAVTGPLLYLVLAHPGSSNQYFMRAGFTFGVLGSAWGWALVLDRARLPAAGRAALAAGAVAFAGALIAVQWAVPATVTDPAPYAPLASLWRWAAGLAALGAVAALVWWLAADAWPALRGRGAAVALTLVLLAGAPGLVMEARAAATYPNGGAWAVVPMPAARVEAARWVRDHSEPSDVVATNVHCLSGAGRRCDARSFWLSGYAQRSVLVEGWTFAPRMVGVPGGVYAPFWDPERLARNDAAFTAPTAAGLRELRAAYGVRWLVVDRAVAPESPLLADLAERRFDNGRLAVYEIPPPG